jgi:hypothetical protein
VRISVVPRWLISRLRLLIDFGWRIERPRKSKENGSSCRIPLFIPSMHLFTWNCFAGKLCSATARNTP